MGATGTDWLVQVGLDLRPVEADLKALEDRLAKVQGQLKSAGGGGGGAGGGAGGGGRTRQQREDERHAAKLAEINGIAAAKQAQATNDLQRQTIELQRQQALLQENARHHAAISKSQQTVTAEVTAQAQQERQILETQQAQARAAREEEIATRKRIEQEKHAAGPLEVTGRGARGLSFLGISRPGELGRQRAELAALTAQLRQAQQIMRSGKGDVAAASREAERLVREIMRANSNIAKLQHGFLGTGDHIDKIVKKVATWTVATGAVFMVIRNIENSLRNIVQVDFERASLAKLYRSGNPEEQTRAGEQLTRSAAGLGALYGEDITNVQKQMQGFVRQGYNVNETIYLTNQSLKLQKATALEAAEAQKFLTTQIETYNLSLQQTAIQVDALNQLENTFAAETKETAEGIQRSAGAAKQAGVEIEELGAIMAATIEATQLSGSNIGVAYKTIFARLASPETIKQLEEVGIQINFINEKTKEQKDSFSILQELAAKWEYLDTPTRKQLAIAVAGQRQWSIFATTMDNFGRVLDGVREQYDSMNSSSVEVARMQETVIGKWERLQKIIQAIVSDSSNTGSMTDVMKGTLDSLIAFAESVQTWDPARLELTLSLIVSFFSTLSGIRIGGAFGPIGAAIGGVVAALGGLAAAQSVLGSSTRDTNAAIEEQSAKLRELTEQEAATAKLVGSYEMLAREVGYAAQNLTAMSEASKTQEERDKARDGALKRVADQLRIVQERERDAGGTASTQIQKVLDMEALRKMSIEDIITLLGREKESVLDLAEVTRQHRISELRDSRASMQLMLREQTKEVYKLEQQVVPLLKTETRQKGEALGEIKRENEWKPGHAWRAGRASRELADSERRLAEAEAELQRKKGDLASGQAAYREMESRLNELLDYPKNATTPGTGEGFEPVVPDDPTAKRSGGSYRFPTWQIPNIEKIGKGEYADLARMFEESGMAVEQRLSALNAIAAAADARVKGDVQRYATNLAALEKESPGTVATFNQLVAEAERTKRLAGEAAGKYGPESGGGDIKWPNQSIASTALDAVAKHTVAATAGYCARWVKQVLDKADVHVAGGNAVQFGKNLGTAGWQQLGALSADDFMPGDVLVVNRGDVKTDHIAIYTGGGRFSENAEGRARSDRTLSQIVRGAQYLVYRRPSGASGDATTSDAFNFARSQAQRAAQVSAQRLNDWMANINARAAAGDPAAMAQARVLAGLMAKRGGMEDILGDQRGFMGVQMPGGFVPAGQFGGLKLTKDAVEDAAKEFFGFYKAMGDIVEAADALRQAIGTSGLQATDISGLEGKGTDLTSRLEALQAQYGGKGYDAFLAPLIYNVGAVTSQLEYFAEIAAEFQSGSASHEMVKKLAGIGIWGEGGLATKDPETIRAALRTALSTQQNIMAGDTIGVGNWELQSLIPMLGNLSSETMLAMLEALGEVSWTERLRDIITRSGTTAAELPQQIDNIPAIQQAAETIKSEYVKAILQDAADTVAAADSGTLAEQIVARKGAFESLGGINLANLTDDQGRSIRERMAELAEQADKLAAKIITEDVDAWIENLEREQQAQEKAISDAERRGGRTGRDLARAGSFGSLGSLYATTIGIAKAKLDEAVAKAAGIDPNSEEGKAAEKAVGEIRKAIAEVTDKAAENEAERIGFIADQMDVLRGAGGDITKAIADTQAEAASRGLDKISEAMLSIEVKGAKMLEDALATIAAAAAAAGRAMDPDEAAGLEFETAMAIESAKIGAMSYRKQARANTIAGLTYDTSQAQAAYAIQRRSRLASLNLLGSSGLQSQLGQIAINRATSIAELRRQFESSQASAKEKGVPWEGEELLARQQQLAFEEVKINEDAQDRIVELYRNRFVELRDMYQDFFKSIIMDLSNVEGAFKRLSDRILSDAVDRMLQGFGVPGTLAGGMMRGAYGQDFRMNPVGLGMAGAAAGGMMLAAGPNGQPIAVPISPAGGFGSGTGTPNLDRMFAGAAGPGRPYNGLGGSNTLSQLIGFSGIGYNAAQSGNPLTGMISGGLQGFALGGPIGAGIGGVVGLLSGLFGGGRKADPYKEPEPYSLPTSADLQFAAPWLLPRQAFLGGRTGGAGAMVDNSTYLQVNGDLVFPNVTDEATARDAARAFKAEFASAKSGPARQLEQQLNRVRVSR